MKQVTEIIHINPFVKQVNWGRGGRAMTRLRWTHRPRRGDKFHDASRGPWRTNGHIIDVLWEDHEVRVLFQTKVPKKHEMDTYDFDEIEGRWTDKFGGTWLLDEGPDAALPSPETSSDLT